MHEPPTSLDGAIELATRLEQQLQAWGHYGKLSPLSPNSEPLLVWVITATATTDSSTKTGLWSHASTPVCPRSSLDDPTGSDRSSVDHTGSEGRVYATVEIKNTLNTVGVNFSNYVISISHLLLLKSLSMPCLFISIYCYFICFILLFIVFYIILLKRRIHTVLHVRIVPNCYGVLGPFI